MQYVIFLLFLTIFINAAEKLAIKNNFLKKFSFNELPHELQVKIGEATGETIKWRLINSTLAEYIFKYHNYSETIKNNIDNFCAEQAQSRKKKRYGYNEKMLPLLYFSYKNEKISTVNYYKQIYVEYFILQGRLSYKDKNTIYKRFEYIVKYGPSFLKSFSLMLTEKIRICTYQSPQKSRIVFVFLKDDADFNDFSFYDIFFNDKVTKRIVVVCEKQVFTSSFRAWLLTKNNRIVVQDKKGITPLIIGALTGDMNLVKYFCTENYNNIKDHTGRRPIEYAWEVQRLPVVDFLIESNTVNPLFIKKNSEDSLWQYYRKKTS